MTIRYAAVAKERSSLSRSRDIWGGLTSEPGSSNQRVGMLSVYNYMASGVLLTGIVAMLFAPYAQDVLISANGRGLSGLGWIVTLAPLAFVMIMTEAS